MDFKSISEYYDLMYVNEEAYQKEVDGVFELADKYAPGAKTLLDIACGTGAQAKYFSERFNVTGIDISREMLEIAKSKVPNAEFEIADMTDFDLGRKFDIIVNLYGSIGFASSFEHLCSSLKCVYDHLDDNGLFILTPWSTKEEIKDGLVAKSKKEGLSGYCRMETVKRIADDKVQVEMHHLVAKDLDVKYHKTVSTVTLFSEAEYVSALEKAGFIIKERLTPEQFRMGAFVCIKG